ncbi:hypothetical protein IFM89_024732 [Coptis chinensis]|uniref:DUF668 domain-containing protein n=1 Tax=Coptis chinensis TaxID=261450 RepID=A0A835HB58_9MAGN|nr:hypothetical protein IFM89_024732 [Coptis chinensis]
MVNEWSFSSLWWRGSRKNVMEPEKLVIGVLTFEVSNLMSKVVHLWQCLSEKQVVRWKEEVMNSDGVKKLVSDDEDFLLGLMCGEIIENLKYLVRFVGRLGNRCTHPGLLHFEQVFSDLLQNNADPYGLEYVWKKMERKMKKMERFIVVSATLYQELEVLVELEQTFRRMRRNDSSQMSLLQFQQKVIRHRQEVKSLRDNSIWSRSYDYTVRLLGRSLFTIFGRIKRVFGIDLIEASLGNDTSKSISIDYLSRSQSFSGSMLSSVHPSESNLARVSSGRLGRSCTQSGSISGTVSFRNGQWQTTDPKQPYHGVKRLAAIGPFKGCMMSGTDSPVIHCFMPLSTGHLRSNGGYSGIANGARDDSIDSFAYSNTLHDSLPLFLSKCKVSNDPPLTLGAAALALHYANVIIVIERLVTSPELIGPDARDDLYNMLPTSLRVALRARLKSYVRNLNSFVCDTDFAAEWSEALTRILDWMAPLAHNMIRWQSERNFEQQHFVTRTNVLLVQTLHFANQAKTEAAITELLVGLNYLWRHSRALDTESLQGCASRQRIGDCLC